MRHGSTDFEPVDERGQRVGAFAKSIDGYRREFHTDCHSRCEFIDRNLGVVITTDGARQCGSEQNPRHNIESANQTPAPTLRGGCSAGTRCVTRGTAQGHCLTLGAGQVPAWSKSVVVCARVEARGVLRELGVRSIASMTEQPMMGDVYASCVVAACMASLVRIAYSETLM